MLKKPYEILDFIEKGIGYFALILLAVIPFLESIVRLAASIFSKANIMLPAGIPSSAGIIVHLLLVLGLVSAMITTKSGDHLSIGLINYIKNEKLLNLFSVVSGLLSAFITTMLIFCSAVFIKIGLSPARMIGFIPDQVFALTMPAAYLVMAVRFARLTPLKGKLRILPYIAILLGIVCSLPVVFKFIYGFNAPDFVYTLSDAYITAAGALRPIAIAVLVLAALSGTPLFVIIASVSIILLASSGSEIDVTANQIYTALTQTNIVAIPLFTLAGFILSESKAGLRLVEAFRACFSWLPGGMIVVTVVICAFFTSFTGASGVTILALGGILYTVLCENSKYPEKFSVGLLASCGSIGLLFPPSLPLILVGTTTQTNILHLFISGITPGIILTLGMIVFGIIISLKVKIPREKFNVKNAAGSIKKSGGEILLPFLLIGGYFTGLLSLVELGAFAVIYIFVLEVLIWRDIPMRDVPKVFAKAIPIIGGILSILALAQALSYYIVDTQAPENFARWMQSAITSKWLFLLILNLALLVVGCLIDIFSAIVIVLPLLLPLADAFGIDKVHLGIIFLINMEAGFLTPPVGLNLFLASYRFKKPFVEICRSIFPFLLIQLAVIFLITYIPQISTFLLPK
ncbi:TRAP transporter subunit DctM [Spirochaetia bacterium]|nr:TRAP transporter subunit DctM [Spirochaetia bacterium]